jgi:hypothetical protein
MKNKSVKQIDDQIASLEADRDDLFTKCDELGDKISDLQDSRQKIVASEKRKFRLKFSMSWTKDIDDTEIWFDDDQPLKPTAQDVRTYLLNEASASSGLYHMMNDWDLHPENLDDDKIEFDVVQLNTVEV